MADPGVHDADPGVHERRSWRSRSPDPAVHDEPTRVFTIVRNPQPLPLHENIRGGRYYH
jgi:hypothetical protein